LTLGVIPMGRLISIGSAIVDTSVNGTTYSNASTSWSSCESGAREYRYKLSPWHIHRPVLGNNERFSKNEHFSITTDEPIKWMYPSTMGILSFGSWNDPAKLNTIEYAATPDMVFSRSNSCTHSAHYGNPQNECLWAKLFERTKVWEWKKALSNVPWKLSISPFSRLSLRDEQDWTFINNRALALTQGMRPAVAALKDNSLSNWRKSGMPNFFQVRIKPSATLSYLYDEKDWG